VSDDADADFDIVDGEALLPSTTSNLVPLWLLARLTSATAAADEGGVAWKAGGGFDEVGDSRCLSLVCDCRRLSLADERRSTISTRHSRQVSLSSSLCYSQMTDRCHESTSFDWEVSRHTTRCTSPVYMVLQCKEVCHWGLRKQKSAAPSAATWPGIPNHLVCRYTV